MNKKIVMLTAGVALATVSFAQKSKINEASKELDNIEVAKIKKDEAAITTSLQKAKEAINLAVNDESTKANAKAWFTKAAVYMAMQENPQTNADKPYKEGIVALNKAIELDKKYASDDKAISLLANGAFYYYNDGIAAYNESGSESKYEDAYNNFKAGADLTGADKDKRFATMPIVDTIRAQSKMFMGYTSFYGGKFDRAIPLLLEAKASPYLSKEPNVYLVLAQAYEKTGKAADQLATLQEAKQKFPEDKNVSNAELNYFIASGKEGEMTAKLEEAAAKEPNNPELPFNLGIVYEGMANPKGGAAPPKNAAELNTKAEAAYSKALALASDNANYNYQFGAFYYNQAANLNTQMNNLGSSKSEQQQYNTLLKQRDDLFAKALPLLEKSRQAFSTREGKLTTGEHGFYRQSLEALSRIYAIQDKLDKSGEMKKKLNSLPE